jgi:hypothetical protein
MKSNSLSTFLILILAGIFLSCSNSKKKDPIQEAKDETESETERHLAEMTARMKWPWVEAKETPIDSLDIKIEDLSIPLLDLEFDVVKDSVFILSEDEFNMARYLVKKHFDSIDTSVGNDSIDDRKKPFPYNYYFKQYIGYKEKDGKRLVYVNMFTSWQTPNGWARELKDKWLMVYDGGKSFGHIIVDIEKKEVKSLYIHGPY